MTVRCPFLALWCGSGLADARDDEHVRHDALGVAHHAVAARQVLDHIVAHAERRLLPADRRRALHQRAVELVAADLIDPDWNSQERGEDVVLRGMRLWGDYAVGMVKDCNWLQHYENIVDPYHLLILHQCVEAGK
jgi:hypothetical protein